MDLAGETNGTLVALALTFLFRLGASRRSMQRFTLAATTADDLNQFMENQGRLWGARRDAVQRAEQAAWQRSEEHTSELQSLMRISYAVFCLKKKKNKTHNTRPLPRSPNHK